MNALRWHLRRLLSQLGLPGVVAALLTVAALGHGMAIEAPAQARLDALEAEVAQLQTVRPQAPSRALSAAPRGAAAVTTFESRFPDEARSSAVFARVQAVALRSGVAIERADFKLERGSGDALSRYVMQLPLSADYRALRRFLRELLADEPAIALEEVSLRRDDPKAALVDAQIRLVLFLQPASRRSGV